MVHGGFQDRTVPLFRVRKRTLARPYDSSREVRVGLVFNDERLHTELDYRTSVEVGKPNQALRDRDDDSISNPRGSRNHGCNLRSVNFYILQSCTKEIFHGRCTSPRYCALTRRFFWRVAVTNKFDVEVIQAANLSREPCNLRLESIRQAGRIGFEWADDHFLL